MPDESTIRKLTRRCGPELIEALNRELLAAADERGEVDVERVRVDTTVVEADIKYPTDSGLLTAATCRIASRLRRLRNAGVKVSFIDRTSEARALQHSIGVWLRRRSDEAKAEVLVITGQLAELAAAAVAEATNALHYKARRRRVRSHARGSRGARRTHHAGHRPGPRPGRRATSRREPPGSCRSMNPTPDRSARDDSASPSSSATRRRSSTTPTG